jgi:hypothetical protein
MAAGMGWEGILIRLIIQSFQAHSQYTLPSVGNINNCNQTLRMLT